MKFLSLTLLIAACTVASCGNDSATTQKIAQEKHQAAWIDSFREFRNAVYQRNKPKVKDYMQFPLSDSNNNIWYMVYDGAEEKTASLANTVKPFTEKDFDRYYDSLFTKRFINCILKLKTEELVKREQVATQSFTEGNTTYIMYATYDKRESRLILNLLSTRLHKVDDETEKIEFSEVYIFDIPADGKIQFKKLELAG